MALGLPNHSDIWQASLSDVRSTVSREISKALPRKDNRDPILLFISAMHKSRINGADNLQKILLILRVANESIIFQFRYKPVR